MSKPAADRTGPGLSGVTPAHRAAWESGVTSYQTIADELGIRKQSLAGYAKRNGWTRDKKAAEAAEPPAPIPLPTNRPTEDSEVEAERTHYSLVQAQRFLLVRCLESIRSGPNLIGCQRLQATLRGIREELTTLGYLPTLQDLERPTQLVIRVMTPEEETAVQRRAEGDGDDDSGESSDNVVPFARDGVRGDRAVVVPCTGDSETASSEAPRKRAGNSSGQGRTGLSGKKAGNSDGGSKGEPQPCWKLPAAVSLPTADDFRDWLYKLAARHGDVSLRGLVLALDGDATARGERGDRDYLIAQVLKLTRADPQAMKPFLPADAA